MAIKLDGSIGVTFPDDEVQFSAVQNTGGTALLYAARAWGVVDMTGLGLLTAVNISDATVNATGDISFTFAQPMATAYYAIVANAYTAGTVAMVSIKNAPTVNGFSLRVALIGVPAATASTSYTNSSYLSFAVFS